MKKKWFSYSNSIIYCLLCGRNRNKEKVLSLSIALATLVSSTAVHIASPWVGYHRNCPSQTRQQQQQQSPSVVRRQLAVKLSLHDPPNNTNITKTTQGPVIKKVGLQHELSTRDCEQHMTSTFKFH